MSKTAIALSLALLVLVAPALAVEVQIEITGEVEYSGINGGPFAAAGPGDPANISFRVDEDAFYFATWDPNWPGDFYLDETGILGQFANHFELGYTENTLTSIDILNAAGTYDYDGLTRFWYVLLDDWAEAAGLLFTQMTITPIVVATDDASWSRVKSLY